jgi:hypothetical protein
MPVPGTVKKASRTVPSGVSATADSAPIDAATGARLFQRRVFAGARHR